MRKKKKIGVYNMAEPDPLPPRPSSRVIEVQPASNVNLKARMKSSSRFKVPFGTSVKVAEPRSIAAYRQNYSSFGGESSSQRDSAKLIRSLSRDAERARSKYEAIQKYKRSKNNSNGRPTYSRYGQTDANHDQQNPSAVKKYESSSCPTASGNEQSSAMAHTTKAIDPGSKQRTSKSGIVRKKKSKQLPPSSLSLLAKGSGLMGYRKKSATLHRKRSKEKNHQSPTCVKKFFLRHERLRRFALYTVTCGAGIDDTVTCGTGLDEQTISSDDNIHHIHAAESVLSEALGKSVSKFPAQSTSTILSVSDIPLRDQFKSIQLTAPVESKKWPKPKRGSNKVAPLAQAVTNQSTNSRIFAPVTFAPVKTQKHYSEYNKEPERADDLTVNRSRKKRFCSKSFLCFKKKKKYMDDIHEISSVRYFTALEDIPSTPLAMVPKQNKPFYGGGPTGYHNALGATINDQFPSEDRYAPAKQTVSLNFLFLLCNEFLNVLAINIFICKYSGVPYKWGRKKFGSSRGVIESGLGNI